MAFEHFTEAIRLHPRCATYHANRCGLTAATHEHITDIVKQAVCTSNVVEAL